MTELAILGLEAAFGPDHTLEDYARAIYAGQPLAVANLADPTAQLAQATSRALEQARCSQQQRLAAVLCTEAMGEAWANPVIVQLTRRWDFLAPTLSAPTLGQALALAREVLGDQQADLVLLMAANGSEAEAMVLAREDDTQVNEAYAIIEAGQNNRLGASGSETQLPLADIGYLETLTELDQQALAAYRLPNSGLSCALSSGAPSAMAAFVKVVLCLHRRFFPPWAEWTGPLHPELWQDTPFYVAPEARPWFTPRSTPRRAGLHLTEATGVYPCILVEPGPGRRGTFVCPQPGQTTLHLLPVAAHDLASLLAKLSALHARITAGTSIETLARETFVEFQRKNSSPWVLALTSHDLGELDREIAFAVEGLPKAFETGQAWTSPRGSYFTARPLGPEGLTFVYPGAFNAYVGLGRDLFQHFPWLHEHLAAALPDVGQSLAEHLLYPRHLAPIGDSAESAKKLAADPAAMIEVGTIHSLALTALLRHVFGVRPTRAFGYSLGEISMLWSGEVWTDLASGSTTWRESPLFKTRLFGPKEAVREAWGLTASAGDEFWHTYLLKAPVEKVQAALTNERQVYLTMVNLRDEVVIAGEPAACLRVINGLKGHAIRIPFDSVLHNPTMRSEHSAMAELYRHPIEADSQVTYFSAGHYAPLALEPEPLASTLADMVCQPLDFPRLVNEVYDHGARLFVEVGPQGTCTRWIERILRGREFAALPLNRPRAGDYDGIVSVLAMLISHGVPVNLAPLYGELARATSEQSVPMGQREHLNHQASLQAEGHQAFLLARQTALRQTAELMALQTSLSAQMLTLASQQTLSPTVPHLKPVIDKPAIEAFASGDPEACFGPAYAVYRGRRLPRLPNGDLLLVDRVLAIEGTAGKVEVGATLTSAFDVPADAWFMRRRTALPHVALMELALQPCGILAAYLGSTLPYPELDFYFRNLDGQAELLNEVDVRRQTIVNRVRLVSSAALQGIILQKYEFELSCGAVPFYRGHSSFGYFTREALSSQAGLGDAELPPHPDASQEWSVVDGARLGHSQLDFLEQAWVSPQGGRHGLGRVYAEVPVQSTDWFFKCHFFQDPVMPGSLGVEAVRQAVELLGRASGARQDPTGLPLTGRPMTWKYRGQMTPENGRLRLDAHVTQLSTSATGLTLVAEASVWKDTCRLYEIKNLGVTLPNTPANER